MAQPWRLGVICSVCVLVCGCAVGPDYQKPVLVMPERFQAVANSGQAAPASNDPTVWWHTLGDAQLDALVDEALRHNLDLERAIERLQQSRSMVALYVSAELPSMDLSSGGGNGTGTDLTRGRTPAGIHSADHTTGSGSSIKAASGADMGLALDWVGGLRRQIEAARSDLAAAEAARDGVQVAVTAEVVGNYLQLRGLQAQYQLLHADADTLGQTRDVIQARFEHGITNEFDLTLAERQLAAVHAQLPQIESQIEAHLGAIAVLTGHFDGEAIHHLDQAQRMPPIPNQIDPGLPIDLVRRRPDIREAEARLAAETARVGVATAALFPQLTLGAGLGSQYTAGTGSGHQSIWSAGYSAYFPLLDFGALDAQVQLASSRQREALIAYRQRVIAAVQEVDNAVRDLQASGIEV